MIYLNDIPLDTFMKYYDTEKNSEHNYTPLTEDLIPDDLLQYGDFLSPTNLLNLDTKYQTAFKTYFNGVKLDKSKIKIVNNEKNYIVYSFPLIYDETDSTNSVILTDENKYLDEELTHFNFTNVNMISQFYGNNYNVTVDEEVVDTTTNTGLICYKYTFPTKKSVGSLTSINMFEAETKFHYYVEKKVTAEEFKEGGYNILYTEFNNTYTKVTACYVMIDVTSETFSTLKNSLYIMNDNKYETLSDSAIYDEKIAYYKLNYDSNIKYYIDSNRILSYTSTNIFLPYKTYYTIIYDESLENPVYIYFFIEGTKQTMPKRTNNGDVLYRDSSGLLTTEPKYINNFYRHQSAIRKAFFGLTKETGWMYKIKPDQICLLQKGNKYQIAYHKDYIKTTKYEYNSDHIGDGTEDVINFNRNLINESTLVNPKIITETVKTPFYVNYLSDFTTYKAYTSSYDIIDANKNEYYYRIPKITEIMPSDSETAKYDHTYGNIQVYNRTIQFLNADDKDTYTMEISNNDTIHYYAAISNTLDLKTLTEYEGTVFEINSNKPYVLIPLLIGTAALLSKLNNEYIVLSNTNGADGFKMTGKLSIDPLDISTASITYDNKTTELLLDIDDLNELEKACIKNILSTKKKTITGEEKTIEESYEKIFFIKVPLKVLKESLIDNKIGDIRSIKRADSTVTELQTTSDKVSEITSSIKNILKQAISIIFPITIINTSNILLNIIEDTNYSITAEAIDGDEYYKNKFEIQSLSDEYIKKINEEIASKTLPELYENYNGEEIEYYSNPWSSSKPYVKKIVSYNIVSLTDEEISDLSTLPISFTKFTSYFSNRNLLADDGMAALRGSAVPEEVFINKRKSALSSTLSKLFELSDDSDTKSLFFDVSGNNGSTGVKNVINDSDGVDKVYNYCKGINSLVKNGIRNFSAEDVIKRTLTDPSDFYYNIILTSESSEILKVDAAQSLYNSVNNGVIMSQDILTGLKIADTFPTKQQYIEYQSALAAATTNATETAIDNNVNIKKSVNSTSTKYDYTTDVLNKISKSLAKLYANGNISQFLLNGITSTKLEKISDIVSYGKDNVSTYKEVYSSISKVDKNQNKNDTEYIKYVDDILYKIIFKEKEIYNE